MKKGFSTGFLRPDSLDMVFEVCGESGIRLLELWEHDGFFADVSDPESVRERFESEGIEINSVHAPFCDGALLLSGEEDRYVALFERACRKAAVYGASYVVVHPSVVEGEEAADSMPRSVLLWRKLEAVASDHGVRAAFENLPRCRAWPEGLSPMRIAGIIRSCDMRNTRLCLDVSHCFAIGIAPLVYDALAELNPIGVHVSDGIYENCKDRHLPPGEGDFDWERFLRILREKCASASLIIEVNTPYLDGVLLGKISRFLSEKELLVSQGLSESGTTRLQ